MIDDKDIIRIGTITRLHGKQGELQCRLQNDIWYDIDASFLIMRIDGLLVPFRISDWRDKNSECILLTLKGVTDETAALKLVNSEVYALRKDVKGSNTDEEPQLLWQDLKDYSLYNADRVLMGTIEHIDETTANIVAQTEEGYLFPLHEDLIIDINTEQRTIQLNLPDLRL